MSVHQIAVVDTSIIAAIRLYEPSELPDTMLITSVTLGGLSYGQLTIRRSASGA